MRRREKNHGLSGSPEYRAWRDVKKRCYNPNVHDFKNYGARGITMCGRWRNSFLAFLKDMGLRSEGLTLERINNDGDYEPSNCKWASMKEQRRNCRRNRIIEFDGKKQCLADWADEIGLKYSTLKSRLYHGWSVERALTQTMR